MRLASVYFSATGNTAKIAGILNDEFYKNNFEVITFDITSYSNRKPISFEQYDFVIFGFPIYGSFPPNIILEWLNTIKGNGKNCAQYFTYGGPTVGVAHYTTKELLNHQGYRVLASGEFLGKHTYNVGHGFNLMEGRPNEEDFQVAKEFAKEIIKKLVQDRIEEVTIERPENLDVLLKKRQEPPNQPKRPSMISPPSRGGKICSMCFDCERLCPVHAFNAETGEANDELCIKCMRCLTICPDQVITINDLTELFNRFKERMDLSDAVLASKKSRYFI
ncbi:MAG: EFR1 family ferrodoxin [Candidatus Heimdallarchaeota archaeon]|nr:EFR1 family ferrodoxin [Candidatus Heimdallarchaeota archaeon]